jgi:outer membrane protein OmpA-like peptidoglycan-associated protein
MRTGESKMKKMRIFVMFIFIAAALAAQANEPKKIYKLQKAYMYLEESLLISETDLNCSYFIKDDMDRDMQIVDSYQPDQERLSHLAEDSLFINKGSAGGLKAGDMLLIVGQGRRISGLGRYFLKKALAEIISVYEDRSLIKLKSCCHPVHVGDFAVSFEAEPTLFAKKFDYLTARFPENPVSGRIVYRDLVEGSEAVMSSSSQYVTIDLGKGVVDRGSLLLVYRVLKRDLPPLIIGSAIVIHAENTNATAKILDCNSDVLLDDRVLLLPAGLDKEAAGAEQKENIPIVDTLQAEAQADEKVQDNADSPPSSLEGALTVDVLFDFDSRQPNRDHSADFASIKEFIDARSEYLVTLRGYTCSIGGEEYNLRLAKERVDTIRNILVSQYGVDAAHVEAFFYGEKEPLFDNSSEAERLKNRLVKIEVSGK